VEQRSHVVFPPLSLYHHIQKMTKRAKSRPLRALLMKNELVVRMLIMIIFLAPIDDWLVFRRFFSLACGLAQKDAERKEGKHNLFLARRKKTTTTTRKGFSPHHFDLFTLSPFSLFLSLSLFLFLRSTRKNRLIVSFYKFPCLSSLVRRAKSRRRARTRVLSTRQSPISTHGLSIGIKKQQNNITCHTDIPKNRKIRNKKFVLVFIF
jgi:hypothetical protein